MDADTVARVMGLVLITLGFGILMLSVAGLMGWYGMINIPWLNPGHGRKAPPDDTTQRRN